MSGIDLQEAGYKGKSLFPVEEEEEEDLQHKVDDEVRLTGLSRTAVERLCCRCELHLGILPTTSSMPQRASISSQ